MKKLTKLWALLLTVSMLAVLFAGCGSSSSTTETSSAATGAAETAAAATDAAAGTSGEAATETSGAATGEICQEAIEQFGADAAPEQWTLPLSDGSETLTLWATFPDPLFASYPNGMADCDIYKEAQKETGVDIEYTALSTSASSEKFNIMCASGEYPDMIGWGLNYTGGDESAVDQDVYMDLTKTIAQYAPNYYNLLATDADLLKSATTDSGYITNFFALVTEDGLASFGPMIRTDLLDKVGMEKPYTIDEYHDVLTAFKNAGVTEPLVMLAPGCAQDNWIAAAYGVAGYLNNFPTSSAPFYVEDGTVKFGVVESGFKDYITEMHQWYTEGLIGADFISENANWNGPDYSSKITNGDCGIFYSDYGNIGGYNSTSEVSGFHVEATYDAHETADSVNHLANFSKKSAGNGIHLTTTCSDVQLAAQWCDWWYTDSASLLANYGIEGKSYEMVDGTPTYTDVVTKADGMSIRDALLVYASNNTICCVIDSHALDTAYSQEDLDAKDIWATGMDDEWTYPTGASMSADETEEYNGAYTDIETLCMENIAQFITGAKDMSEFDSFVAQVKSMGLDTCISIKQDAYDRYIAK